MRDRRFVIFSLILIICCSFCYTPEVQAVDDLGDIDVVVVITTAFGWNYFDIVETLENWGVNVTTASATLTLEVDGCFNKDPTTVTADLLVSEIDNETLEQFDALVIPSGGHWNGLVSSRRVLNLISSAHARGLVIATMCIGNRVVCRANNIVNHTKVATYTMTNNEMRNQGATVVASARVVSDNRIVTGGAGAGYLTGGHEGAPYLEVCTELVKAVLGVSHVESVDLEPTTWNETATYEIVVDTQDPSAIIEELNESEISTVKAIFYPLDGLEDSTKTVTLTDDDDDGVYTGAFTDLRRGSYNMTIEVETEDDHLEVIDTELGITYEEPPLELGLFTIGGVIGVIAVVIVIVVVFVKRKG